MRIHIIACKVFFRELSYYASQSSHLIDITWLPQGLHDTPSILHKKLKATIDAIELQEKNKPHAIVLCYGLCSNGVLNLSSQTIPLVIPKTDDCIALFLGSQLRYITLFETYKTTYWLNSGWIEHAYIPSKENRAKKMVENQENYGEENAVFLDEQDELWIKNYTYCGYISSVVYKDAAHEAFAKQVAQDNNWKLLAFDGDDTMIKALTQGNWNTSDFLYCPPHHTVVGDYAGEKIKAVPN